MSSKFLPGSFETLGFAPTKSRSVILIESWYKTDMEWFVYVLLNAGGVAYTGISKDVAARLEKHNAGSGAKFTRGRGPWRVIHVEGPMSRPDALRRELAIKRDTVFKAGLKRGALPQTGPCP